jgi:hypothetical protein
LKEKEAAMKSKLEKGEKSNSRGNRTDVQVEMCAKLPFIHSQSTQARR